jgi:hypothetical protein
VKVEEEVLVLKTESEGERPQQLLRDVETSPVESAHEVAEAREHVLGQPDIRLLGEVIAADLVALLLDTVA